MAYDRFSSPDAGYDWEQESSPQEKALEAGKKFLPVIIGLIVLAGVGWFAYDFLVGSMRDVAFTINDAEGNPISAASIKVYDAANNEVFRSAGQAVHRTQLRAGDYSVHVVATGYQSLSGKLVSVTSNGPIPLVLEKNIEVELQNVAQSFPKTLVAGQTLEATLSVKNKGSRTAEVEFVFGGDLQQLPITVLPSPFTVAGESTATAVLKIEVPRSIAVDPAKGSTLSGDIRVKYTLEKERVSVQVFPTPSLKVSSVAFGRLDAGETQVKDITITNNSNFPISDLTLSFVITNAQKNHADAVKAWFVFNEIANQDDPQTLVISQIDRKKSVKKQLRVDISPLAKKEEIAGNLVVSANYLAEPVIAPLSLEIDRELNVALEARVSPATGVTVAWVPAEGVYEEKPVKVNFRNTGVVPIENIQLSVENAATCHVGWLELREQSIAVLQAGADRDVTIFASAPNTITAAEQKQACKLRYRYDNPSNDPSQPAILSGEIENFFYITAKK